MSISRRKTKTRGTVYDVRLRTPSGSHHKHTCSTLRAARVYEAKQLAEMATGQWFDPAASKTLFATVAAEVAGEQADEADEHGGP